MDPLAFYKKKKLDPATLKYVTSRRSRSSIQTPYVQKKEVKNDLTPQKDATGKLLLPQTEPKDANVVARFQRSYTGRPEPSEKLPLFRPEDNRLPLSAYEQEDIGSALRRDQYGVSARNDVQLPGTMLQESRFPDKGMFHDLSNHPEIRYPEKEHTGMAIPARPVQHNSHYEFTDREFNARIRPEQPSRLPMPVTARPSSNPLGQRMKHSEVRKTAEDRLPAKALVTTESTLQAPEFSFGRDGTRNTHKPSVQLERGNEWRPEFLGVSDRSHTLPQGAKSHPHANTERHQAELNAKTENKVAIPIHMLQSAMPKVSGSLGAVSLSDMSTKMSMQPASMPHTKMPLAGGATMRDDNTRPVRRGAQQADRHIYAPESAVHLQVEDNLFMRDAALNEPYRIPAAAGDMALRPDADRSQRISRIDTGERRSAAIETVQHRNDASVGMRGVTNRSAVTEPAVSGDVRHRSEPSRVDRQGLAVRESVAMQFGEVQPPSSEPPNILKNVIRNVSNFLQHNLFGTAQGKRTETHAQQPAAVIDRGEDLRPVFADPSKAQHRGTPARPHSSGNAGHSRDINISMRGNDTRRPHAHGASSAMAEFERRIPESARAKKTSRMAM
jgi:hypothetical protein